MRLGRNRCAGPGVVSDRLIDDRCRHRRSHLFQQVRRGLVGRVSVRGRSLHSLQVRRVLSRGNVYFRVRPHITCILRALSRVRAELASVFSLAIYRESQFMDQSKSAPGAAALLIACVFTVSNAFADTPDGQVRMEDIKFQDLNLATAAGVDALYTCIHSAALRVCAVSERSDLGAASASAKCSKEATARAVKELNLPALTTFAANL
jgi:UrcA family protein